LGIARDSGTGLSLEAKVFLTEFHIDEKIPSDFYLYAAPDFAPKDIFLLFIFLPLVFLTGDSGESGEFAIP